MKLRALTIAGAICVATLGATLWITSASAVPVQAPANPAPAAKPPQSAAPPKSVFAIPPNALGPINTSGKISLLRVHDLGTAYGPPSDQIDVEVVVQLSNQPTKAFGFQLRNDNYLPSRQGQLDLLRDAFNNNWTVHLDYLIATSTSNNATIIRTWITKP